VGRFVALSGNFARKSTGQGWPVENRVGSPLWGEGEGTSEGTADSERTSERPSSTRGQRTAAPQRPGKTIATRFYRTNWSRRVLGAALRWRDTSPGLSPRRDCLPRPRASAGLGGKPQAVPAEGRLVPRRESCRCAATQNRVRLGPNGSASVIAARRAFHRRRNYAYSEHETEPGALRLSPEAPKSSRPAPSLRRPH
jgi:hypothetical protein